MDVSDARKLKSLEAENAKLKRMLADAMLDNDVLNQSWERVKDAKRTP